MPAAYVNGTSRHNLGATSGNQKQTTYGFNTLASHAGVIAIFYRGASGDLTSIADSLGNNYNVDCGVGNVSRAGNGWMRMLGCPSLIAGTDPTITAVFSAAQTDVDMYPEMWSNVDSASMWNTSGAAQGTATGTTITSPAFTPGITDGAVLAFCVTNDTNGSAGNIGGVLATSRMAPAGWGTVMEDRIFSSSLGSGITAAATMSSSASTAAIMVGILRAGSSLTKKFAIPTALADGTQRYMLAFSNTGLGTKLGTPQLVAASGGFFKYANASAVVGTKYPALLWTYGADQTVDARGGPCWATGIEE